MNIGSNLARPLPNIEIFISMCCSNPHEDLKESSEPVSLFLYECRLYHVATHGQPNRRIHLHFKRSVGTHGDPLDLVRSYELSRGLKGTNQNWKIRSEHIHFQHVCGSNNDNTPTCSLKLKDKRRLVKFVTWKTQKSVRHKCATWSTGQCETSSWWLLSNLDRLVDAARGSTSRTTVCFQDRPFDTRTCLIYLFSWYWPITDQLLPALILKPFF